MIKVTFPNIENQSAEYSTVVDFYRAIFRSDEAQLLRLVTDDCTCVVHGLVRYEGKPGLTKMLDDMKQSGLDHVRVDNIVADKKHAAINGIIILKDGSRVAFADFLTFSPERKIQWVDEYPIALSNETD